MDTRLTKTQVKKLTDALFTAIRNNKTSEIKLLIDEGADLAAENENKQTPIKYAKILDQWECVKTIANSKKTNKNDTYHYGSALLTAVQTNRHEIFKCLLEANAPTTWYTTDNGYRCLHWAVTHQNVAMIALLLQHGADLAKVNKKDETPIQLARNLGYWNCVQTIAQNKKTDDNDTYHYGSALFSAVKANRNTIVKCLLEANAPTRWYTTNNGYRCLHWAVTHQNVAMIALLIKYGANPNVANNARQIPLELACSLGYWACVEFFIQYKQFKFNDSAKARIAFIDAVKTERLDIANNLLRATNTELTSIEQCRYDVSMLYEAMCDNAVKPEDLPATIKYINICHRHILKHDVAILCLRRDQLKSDTSKQRDDIHQPIDVNSALERLNAIIYTINTLLNYPNIQTELSYSLNPDLPEEKDIQHYLDRKQNIDDYICRLHIFLTDTKIKLTHRKVKKFFGMWIDDDTPKSMQIIRDKLTMLSKTPSADEIMNAYDEIIQLLMMTSKLDRTHENTNKFCYDTLQQIASTTFMMPNIKQHSAPINPHMAPLSINSSQKPILTSIRTNDSLLGSIVAKKETILKIDKKQAHSGTLSDLTQPFYNTPNLHAQVSKMSLLSDSKPLLKPSSDTKQQDEERKSYVF